MECFAAFAAHELRNGLTLQTVLADPALSDPDADVTELRTMGERVIDSCRRQERLLDALLTLARSEYEQLQREPLDLATCTTVDRAILTIANSGPLIPLREVDRLFLPFHRLRSHPSATTDGVGLGLAVRRTLCGSAGGEDARGHPLIDRLASRPRET